MRRSLKVLVVLLTLLTVVGFAQSTMTGACTNDKGSVPGQPFPCTD